MLSQALSCVVAPQADAVLLGLREHGGRNTQAGTGYTEHGTAQHSLCMFLTPHPNESSVGFMSMLQSCAVMVPVLMCNVHDAPEYRTSQHQQSASLRCEGVHHDQCHFRCAASQVDDPDAALMQVYSTETELPGIVQSDCGCFAFASSSIALSCCNATT